MHASVFPWSARTRAIGLPLAALLLVAAPACAGAIGPPALNHVYVVLDRNTFDALARDAALLASPDAGLPDYASPADGADRIFLRGRATYLEFFAPDNRFGEPVGKVGLALGYDAPVHLAQLERAWRARYDDVRRTAVEWRRIPPVVPWYDAVQRDATAANPHLVLWAMTYRPEFVDWQAPATLPTTRTARADVLAPRWRPSQRLIDVTGLSVAVPPDLKDRIESQLIDAGFERTRTDTGVVLSGRDWQLTLSASSEPGLRSLELETAADGAGTGCAHVLGRSRLVIGADGRTVWRFDTTSDTPALPACIPD